MVECWSNGVLKRCDNHSIPINPLLHHPRENWPDIDISVAGSDIWRFGILGGVAKW